MIQSDSQNMGLRYLRVADSLRKKVLDGVYKPGDRLPRQHDMARDYGVAFSTLKHALDILGREGYVVRKVGQGTYAALPPDDTPIALVVDDEENVRQFFQRVLSQSGWKTVTVDSGRAALEEVQSRQFDVIFLDLVMPGMGGPDTFREIRKMDSDANVVIITGYPDSAAMADVLQTGPISVMKKPFTRDELRQVIRSAANNHQDPRGETR